MSHRFRFLAAVMLFLTIAFGARAQMNGGVDVTQRELIADTAAVEPGKPFYVGFHFKMQKDWHMYWRFAGGPGDPFTLINWKLPKGWSAEAVDYPIPEVDAPTKNFPWPYYVYADEVVFPVKITPPDKITVTEVTIGASFSWQICKAICLQGKDEKALKLTVGPAKPANEKLFAHWLAELPQTDKPPVGDVKFEMHGKNLAVRVTGAPADAKVDFFPIPPRELRMEFEMEKTIGTETAPDGARVFTYPFGSELPWSGLLVVTGADGQRKAWYIGNPPEITSSEKKTREDAGGEDDGDTWNPFDDVAKVLAGSKEQDGLWALLWQGFLGGLLLNLMPCVLPVISLKIFGFVQQAGEAKARIFKLGLAFCAGVFGFFLAVAILVLALASANKTLGWGAQFSNPIALTVMVSIIFVFGLSLLGVFEITLGGAESKLSEASSKEGYGGAFVHGFFTTLLGTSCTAPLVGPVLGVALNQPGPHIFALFAAIATGLSLPYFLLTWHPAWMRFLPKPGMWMVRFKQILGFVMLAFAVWLLNSFPTAPVLVSVVFFLLVLGLASGVYGTYHEKRWALPVALLVAVGGWLVFIRGNVEPPKTEPSGFLAKVRAGLNANKPVFVDFTAEWCPNCKVNEAAVLKAQAVQDAMKDKKVVFVKADNTQQPPDILDALAKMRRAGVPAYILFRKRVTKAEDFWIGSELLTQEAVLGELKKL